MLIQRGCVEIPTGAIADIDKKLLKHQVADPATTEGVKARESFDVYLQLPGKVVVPKFSPVVKDLVMANQAPSSIGADNEFFTWNADIPLRQAQRPGAEKAFETLRDSMGCLIKGDTGSGKTVVGLNMVYRLQPARTLVLVDQLDIAKQWAVRARQFLPNVALKFLMPAAEARAIIKEIGEPQTPTKGEITIGTAQSLYRSKAYTYDTPFVCELLICDEVHVFGAPTFMQAIFKVNYGRSIGLTATDDRKDGLDWVFRQCLGWPIVEFEGEVMTPEVYKLEAPSGDLDPNEWRRAWCRYLRGFTWKAKCKECMFYSMYPIKCGGNLPLTSTGQPKWDLLNRAGLVSAWSALPEYQAWLKNVIETLMKKRRRTFFFGEGRAFLIDMYTWAAATYGADKVGIYLGKGGADDQIDISFQRHDALDKPLTFVTYGVARKALDVKEKDAAVFATPISDARQAAGRVRRSAAGKKKPIIIVPVPSKIYPFVASWRKIKQQFMEAGWTIRE